jgi:hypothetical protein
MIFFFLLTFPRGILDRVFNYVYFNVSSQELLEAVEQERNFRFNPTRNATIFRHPTLGDFELQHVCGPFTIVLS